MTNFQERKFVGGSMRLSEELAVRLGEKNIKLNEPVIRVEQNRNGVTVTSAKGNVYKVTGL